jgi:uncharacterized membrane protein YadS
MLALVVLATALTFRKEGEQRSGRRPARQALVPWFLWVFVGMVALNSMGALPSALVERLSWASRACLVIAIAALGMKTSFAQLARAGWRPLVLIFIETLWLGALVLGAAVASR